MPLTDQQREERRTGIGGSDAAAVVGRHPTKSPLRLWMEKKYGADDSLDGEWVEWGNLLEEAIAQEAARRLGESLIVPTVTVRHPLEPRMLANPDRILSSGRVLECKNTSDMQWRASEGDRVAGVVRTHWYQVQHYLEVMDAPGAVVAYLVGGSRMELVEVARSRAAGESLRRWIGAWWERHIVGDEPPTEGDASDRMGLLERLHAKESAGMLATQDTDLIATAREYDALRASIKASTARLEEAKATLCAVIGPQSGLDFGAIGKVTWKASPKGTRTFRVTLRDAQEQDQ